MGNHGRWKIKPKLTRVISLSENGKSTVPTGPTGPNMAWHGQIPVVKSPFLGEISFIPSVKRPPRMDHWDFVPSPVSSTESVSFFNFSACGDKPHIGKGECYATRISSTVVHRHGTSCKVLAPSKKTTKDITHSSSTQQKSWLNCWTTTMDSPKEFTWQIKKGLTTQMMIQPAKFATPNSQTARDLQKSSNKMV